MSTTVLRRSDEPRPFGVWDFVSALVAAVGGIYDRNAKKSGQSWHYFAA